MAGYTKQRANWLDYPTTSTPILASNLNAWEQAIYDKKRETLNVVDYGADVTGTVDATSIIQTAIADLPTNGGVIYFPSGIYKINSAGATPINLNGKTGVSLVGSSIAAGASRLTTPSSAGSVVTLGSSYGTRFQNIEFAQSANPYTGVLVDATKATGDTNFLNVQFCTFTMVQYAGAAGVGLKLVGNDSAFILGSIFTGGGTGVLGRATGADYSNVITIQACEFAHQNVVPIRNPFSSWSILGCTFEPKQDGTPGAVSCDVGIPLMELMFAGNWCGDTSSAGTAWLDLVGTAFGLTGGVAVILNNKFDNGVTLSPSGIRLSGPMNALTIRGNYFNNMTAAINLNSQTTVNFDEGGNYFTTVTNKFGGTGGLSSPATYIDNAGKFATAGGFTLTDGTDLAIGSVAGSKIGQAGSKIGHYGVTPVVRPTGWTAATGTPTRTTFATSTVTLAQLAEHVKALIDDLLAQGLLGP